ncbi:hypothetical protein BJX62DRAFT_204751 [Aspergillus germanicus]
MSWIHGSLDPSGRQADPYLTGSASPNARRPHWSLANFHGTRQRVTCPMLGPAKTTGDARTSPLYSVRRLISWNIQTQSSSQIGLSNNGGAAIVTTTGIRIVPRRLPRSTLSHKFYKPITEQLQCVIKTSSRYLGAYSAACLDSSLRGFERHRAPTVQSITRLTLSQLVRPSPNPSELMIDQAPGSSNGWGI